MLLEADSSDKKVDRRVICCRISGINILPLGERVRAARSRREQIIARLEMTE